MLRRSPLVLVLLSLSVLTGSAAGGALWAAETGPPDLATEIWVAPAHNTATNIGDWGVTANGETHFSFAVPADFGSFTAAKVLVIGDKTTEVYYDLFLSISSDHLPQDIFRNVEEGRGPVDLVKEELLEIDVSDIFSFSVTLPPDTVDFPQDLLPGQDYVGLRFAMDPRGKGRVVGLRFQYDAAPQLAGLECPDGLVAGFADDGSLVCKPDHQACPPGTAMVGFDLDGAPLCIPDHQACGPEEVMVGFDLDGLPICKPDSQACGAEEVMVGFDLDGTPLCKPDSQACDGDEVMVGFDLDGLPICKTDSATCGSECFGGTNDGTACTSDEDCTGNGTCQQTVMVGFNLRGDLDCRTFGEVTQGPAGAAFSIQAQVEADEGTDGTTPFVFAVTRSPALGLAETDSVNFVTQAVDAVAGTSCTAGVDYISQAGTLTFTSADCNGVDCSKDITVEVCADGVEEADESFQVVLSLPAGSTSTLVQDTGVGLIRDDDGAAPTTATLTVIISPAGTGAVSGPGISCPTDCQETYPVGTTFDLAIRARAGFTFVGWSGDDECDGSTDNPLTVTMDADQTCTANFE